MQARVLHFACYVVLAVLTAWVCGTTGSRFPFASAVAAVAVLFNPYVLINLFRLNDNNLNVPAIAALFIAMRYSALVVAANRRQAALLGAAAFLGAVAMVRPNVFTLFGIFGFSAGMRGRLDGAHRRVAATVLACAGATVVTYLACSWVIAGRPLFWPTNGPYNLFAGNNPAAMPALVSDYNAEPSLASGLQWCGVDQPIREVAAATLIGCTARFWREHPAESVRLAGMKFYTMLFRPNLRLADSGSEVALQFGTMVLPLAWWTAATVTAIRRRELIDPLALAFVLFYAAPFVVTNADPRFRLPLDGVYALSLASPSVLSKLRGEGRVLSA
jgi:hypothetical protein